jgi:hypothetical protein
MRRANTAKDKPETTMTRFFIAGIAALFLTTGTAHAANVKFKLGPEVLGTWCTNDNGGDFYDGHCAEDDTHNWVTIKRDGWYGTESDCKIIGGKIIGRRSAETKTGRTNPVYKLKMSCYVEGFTSRETFTIGAAKGLLEIRADKTIGETFDWGKYCGSKNEYCDPSDSEDNKWEPPSKAELRSCTKNGKLNYACLRAQYEPCRLGEKTVCACHFGDKAACTKLRVRACRKGWRAACDYDEAQKQNDPMNWCGERYGAIPADYRFCLNGSPGR